MNLDLTKFETEGYIGPYKIFSEDQCEEILTERSIPGVFQTWNKSTHEQSGHVVKTAAHPFIKDKIIALLGNDILLWSSQFIKQKPGQEHVWHIDPELGEGIPDGSWKGVTLWLGLKNLNHKTTLSLITHSHLLDTAPKELIKKNILSSNRNNDEVLREAKKLDSRCELKIFNLNPGEFVIWSGRMWHYTSNQSSNNITRESMILQYCPPSFETKIPANFDYPNIKWRKTKPPCILLFGNDKYRRNKLITLDHIESLSKPLHKFKIKFIYRPLYPIYKILAFVRNNLFKKPLK